MAHVDVGEDSIAIKLSLKDKLLSFQGSFAVPLAHVINAYVSDLEGLDLQYRTADSKVFESGFLTSTGVFANHELVVFADIGDSDYLVLETHGERYKQIAVQLDDGDPHVLAAKINAAVKSEPKETAVTRDDGGGPAGPASD